VGSLEGHEVLSHRVSRHRRICENRCEKKPQLFFFLFFRRSRRRNQRKNDDLWRMWYLGVQSMTLSVSVMGTNGQQQTDEASTPTPSTKAPNASPSKRMPMKLKLPKTVVTSEPENENEEEKKRSTEERVEVNGNWLSVEGKAKPSHRPSRAEQAAVLGVYTRNCALPPTPGASPSPSGASTPSSARAPSPDPTLAEDEAGEASWDWEDAPKQDVDESQL